MNNSYLKVEILRNAIVYIQSLEKCLGISSDDSSDRDVEALDCKIGTNKSYESLRSNLNDENQSVTSSSQTQGGPRIIKSQSSVITISTGQILYHCLSRLLYEQHPGMSQHNRG